uniref:Photosystem I reaction center subunit II n=1 Tax=Hildenbrandia rivularis TaxID=135206 RepID=A0A1C9CFA6_9FLOR|nr:photosystem I subunit II [Hildenbrandia rivularis]AOM67071.1 photosystem I subunit II [Hildenbrandia rivularis]
MSNTINLEIPSPTFGGSTGGWLRAAEIEEKYAITWTSPKKQFFEMPTGGTAIMQAEDNLLYLSKKEQCLALASQLKSLYKISNFKIYRIFPNGEVQYLHPKDGTPPEKAKDTRKVIGKINHSIGKNPDPVSIKFTDKPL